MTTIGQTLAGVREQAGRSVAELSERTFITEPVIEAIERDDFAACGGDFYARGHIRAICRVLGIDPEPLIERFNQEHAERAPQPRTADELFVASAPDAVRGPARRRWPVMVAAVITGMGLLAVANAWPRSDDPTAAHIIAVEPSGAPERLTEAKERPDDRPRRVNDGVVVRATAQERTWIGVTTADGRELFAGFLEQGESREWADAKELRVHVGDAGAVSVEANGEAAEVPGPPGQVMQLTFGPEGRTGAVVLDPSQPWRSQQPQPQTPDQPSTPPQRQQPGVGGEGEQGEGLPAQPHTGGPAGGEDTGNRDVPEEEAAAPRPPSAG
ncbi:helix-turn-helix domain-containing protein [Marinactinospora thermotolerans]|uniref:Protein RodZ, contains Xre-like HTH and DUF4115 domains n=1 Tax=Marinactinospora thermotolerans DSM 45154 TaxID=1122192 RepID=A0A1T4LJG0_9ACTN|nr:helix-turn-helix domain-containing protein [Marinactinospora thermotolerans]SJZ54574.1 protein RodZ, contains Xre-like HTH and DUF4115 domains [Marinactinospora thermotolerans DSM 45154]